MPLNIEQATPGEVNVYSPYYAVARRPLLPLAVGLYKQGNFEGERKIEGGDPVPFIASWFQSPLPSDLTLCQIQFDQDAELTYELSIANYEFVDFLIDVINGAQRDPNQKPDLTTAFYKKLMRVDD